MARREAPLQELRKELGADNVEVCVGDVTSLESQTAAVEQVVARFGPLHATVANAGIGIDHPGTETGDPEEWRRLIDTNILGVLWTAKAALPHLHEHKGHMVLMGSVAGRSAGRGSVYSSSKWFVNGFGQNLANEMAQWGGRCTTIAPGMVDTPFFDNPKPDKLQPEDIAASVMFALDAPKRANVREIYVMPTS